MTCHAAGAPEVTADTEGLVAVQSRCFAAGCRVVAAGALPELVAPFRYTPPARMADLEQEPVSSAVESADFVLSLDPY